MVARFLLSLRETLDKTGTTQFASSHFPTRSMSFTARTGPYPSHERNHGIDEILPGTRDPLFKITKDVLGGRTAGTAESEPWETQDSGAWPLEDLAGRARRVEVRLVH